MTDNNFPHATWRLLITPPLDGATNMAIDEAMAEAAAAGEAPPTLRFYQWVPPCLSLGRNQPSAEVDRAVCTQLGYDVVRRPTGGRSILHTDELTYSVTGAASEPRLAGGVLDAYLRLAEALQLGLERLGLPVQKAPGGTRTGPDVSAACFEVPSAYEITVAGKKLIGSAQSRRQGWVLQHGSLPLYGDITRVVDCLYLPEPGEHNALRETLVARATTLAQVMTQPPAFEEIAQVMIDAFQDTLHIDLVPGALEPAEEARVTRLLTSHYRSEAWTARL
jgi:lipoate-protein ligase A